MIVWADVLRWLHVVGAAVLLGTGAGIAFFMLMAHRTGSAAIVLHVARSVVIADIVFTATAVVVQPLTGLALAHSVGWPLETPWIVVSSALYVLTGLCWLPVVAIQVRMQNLAREAVAKGDTLPTEYTRLFRLWFVLGFPAFASVLAILWLMIARPAM